jgi:hypothetical protein
MSELLATFKKGSTYDNALLSVYGFDMNGLNELWQEHISTVYQNEFASLSSGAFC